MKATGIVRRIDDLGRVVLPKELRRTMNIKEGDPLEIFVDGDQIILKKYEGSEPKCAICESYEDLLEVDSVHICRSCGFKIADKALRE